jgi:hypothetical protein
VELVEEMRKYGVALMGLSETKRKGQGEKQLDGGYCLRFSGVVGTGRAGEGVGIVVSEELDRKVCRWKAISSRIMYVDLVLEETVTVIQIYAPTEDYDSAAKEAFYEELQKEMDEARERSKHVIIMGDWNGRIGGDMNRGQGCMGKFAGDRIVNDNGERMIDFCLENNLMIGNTFYNHKKIHQITFEALGRQAESIIDYMVYTRNTNYFICDVKVIRGAELSTDHKLLIMDIKFSVPKTRKSKTYVRVKVEELRKPDMRDVFSRRMEEELTWQSEEMEGKGIEEIWNTLKTTILSISKQVCGSRRIKERGNKRTKWWSEDVKARVRDKKEAWQRYLRTKSEIDRRAYVEKRNLVKEIVRKAKVEAWEEFGRDLEENFRYNNRVFWSKIRGMKRKTGKKVRNIVNEEGKLISEPKEILKTWRLHYGKKFGGDEDENNEMLERGEIQAVEGNDEISRMEVEEAIRDMKIGKAPGMDELSPEYIKYGGPKVKLYLWHLFKKVWSCNEIPKDWEKNIIIPIFKKGRSVECDNYRAICLSSVGLKIYARILEKRLRREVEERLEEEQSAFRRDRQTQDHICAIRRVMEMYIEEGKELYMAFIDLKAAFDSVKRREIWSAMREMEVSDRLIRAVQVLYGRTVGVVRLDGEVSQEFEMKKGMKQGDSLSPLLFTIFMNSILKYCKRNTPKMKVGYRNLRPVYVQALVFADDIVLMEDSERKLQKAVDVWERVLSRRSMEVNASKSKIMKVGVGERDRWAITCGGHALEEVEQYEYLGVVISNDGRLDGEILNRVKKAMQVYFQLNGTVVGKRELSMETKKRIYNCVFAQTLIYGSESWVTLRKHWSKVTAAEMRYLRRTVGKTRRDRWRNERVREEVGRRALCEDIKERQLKWFGHVIRMPESRVVKEVVEARREGKRRRGRPRTNWQGYLEGLGRERGKTMRDMKRLAESRTEWRRWTEAGTPTL